MVISHVDQYLQEMRAKLDRFMKVLKRKASMVVEELVQKAGFLFMPRIMGVPISTQVKNASYRGIQW